MSPPAPEERAEEAESVAQFEGRELTEECERAERERHRADEAIRQRDDAAQRAAILAERLRALGIDPDAAV